MPAAAPARAEKTSTAPRLLPENVLAWDVLVAMQDQIEAVGGFGFSVIGFRLEALQFVFRVMVPPHRWREVFEQFQILKPYALHSMRAAGGRDGGKGSNDQAAGSGRRKRRP